MTLLHVLVVEDSDEVAAALHESLQDEGFALTAARTHGEALDRAAQVTPDLVLLDVQSRDAVAGTCAALRALRPAPVVVAMSAACDAQTVLGVLRAGATGYLTKAAIGADLPVLLRRCARGDVVLSAQTAAAVLRRALEQPS